MVIARGAGFFAVLVLVVLLVPEAGCFRMPAPKQSIGLDQGWSDEQRERAYSLSEGSRLLPYSWFLALRVAEPGESGAAADHERFASPEHMSRLGYIVTGPGTPRPDGLPIGFTADGVEPDRWLGVNCAACHTSQLRYRGTQFRIDGGSSLADFLAFQRVLLRELTATRDEPERFAVFAADLLGPAAAEAERGALKDKLDAVSTRLKNRLSYGAGLPEFGPGRIDGVGQARNEAICFALGLPENCKPFHVPTNPGFIWRVGDLAAVQSNGQVPADRSLPRNVGQALGVFPDTRITPSGLKTTVDIQKLVQLEAGYEALQPPKWAELESRGVLPPLSAGLREQGAQLYRAQCANCHWERKPSTSPSDRVPVPVFPVAEIGTDPGFTCDFVKNTATVPAPLRSAFARRFPIGPNGETLAMYLTNFLIGATIAQEGGAPPSDVQPSANTPFSGPGTCQANRLATYRAQPLEGVAFTGPYLHNGSVRTLRQLLLPAAQRESKFWIAPDSEFDPIDVGLRNERKRGAFEFDTAIPGNGNSGHEYGAQLSEREKQALLEYMKGI